MSNRNRARAPPRSGGQETGEEAHLWAELRQVLATIGTHERRSKEVVNEIFELEASIKASMNGGQSKPLPLQSVFFFGLTHRRGLDRRFESFK